MDGMTGRQYLLVLVVPVSIVGVTGMLSIVHNDPGDKENKTTEKADNLSVVSSELNETISGYQRIDRTDGIDVIIQVEATQDEGFVNTANNISQITSVGYVFPDQGLVSANATPAEIEEIADIPRVKLIGLDQKTSASGDVTPSTDVVP